MRDDTADLRYVAASNVQSPAGQMASLPLRGADDQPIGSLDGVLLDPIERRLRFYVVRSPGGLRSRRYLLPTECNAQVDSEGRFLRVAVDRDGLAGCQEFHASTTPEYSGDDVLSAIFRNRIA